MLPCADDIFQWIEQPIDFAIISFIVELAQFRQRRVLKKTVKRSILLITLLGYSAGQSFFSGTWSSGKRSGSLRGLSTS